MNDVRGYFTISVVELPVTQQQPVCNAVQGRLALLKINLKDVSKSDDCDLDEIAIMTEGYSGADITNVCRYIHLLSFLSKLFLIRMHLLLSTTRVCMSVSPSVHLSISLISRLSLLCV